MNKSKIFTLAHQLAKVLRSKYGTYREAFVNALEAIREHNVFYTKMSKRIQPVQVLNGTESSGNHSTYFWDNVQYCIRHEAHYSKSEGVDGFWNQEL